MITKGACIFLLVMVGTAQAQINESDTVQFQLRANITGNYQQGNVEVLAIKSKLDFSISASTNWIFKSQNSSLYQSFYKTEADNDVFSRNYLYFRPKKKVYPFVITYLSSNYRRKISNRYFAGAGTTLQWVNSQKNVLKFSACILYESTKFRASQYNYSEYNGKENVSVWRGTLYASGWHYLCNKQIRLYYDAYWQPVWTNKNNYRTQFDLGIDLPIWKNFFFTALLAYSHENVVVTNVLQNDKLITFGLTYQSKSK